jgi:MFS family permease
VEHRSHTPRYGRRPFIAGGSVLTAGGLAGAALGHGSSFLLVTLFGALSYVGVNVVTTAHRALVHDCFEAERYVRGKGAQEVAMLTGGLLGLAVGGLWTGFALWAPFVLAAPCMADAPVAAGPACERGGAAALPTASLLCRRGDPTRHASAPSRGNALGDGVRGAAVFFILYANRVLGLEAGLASVWLAFALGAGLVMLTAGFLRSPRMHKPFLMLGVALMGVGASSPPPRSRACSGFRSRALRRRPGSDSSRPSGSRCSPR